MKSLVQSCVICVLFVCISCFPDDIKTIGDYRIVSDYDSTRVDASPNDTTCAESVQQIAKDLASLRAFQTGIRIGRHGKKMEGYMYYDQESNKAATKIFSGGISVWSETVIYDFNNSQVITIQGFECKVKQMTQEVEDYTGNWTFPFSFVTNNLTMKTPDEVLQVYENNTVEKCNITMESESGLPTTVWETGHETCTLHNVSLDGPLDAVCFLQHYYSRDSLIVNNDTEVRWYPVRTTFNKANQCIYKIDDVVVFFHFQREIVNNIDLQQPEGVFCPDKKSEKELPTLPGEFYFEASLVEDGQGSKKYVKVWYSEKSGMIRRDWQVVRGDTQEKTTEISNYIDKKKYRIDSTNDECIVLLLDEELPSPDVALWEYEASQEDTQYVGRRPCLSYECDVWISKKGNITFEFYFRKMLQHPVALYITDLSASYENDKLPTLLNRQIFLYSSTIIDRSVYDVFRCLSEKSSIQFSTKITGEFDISSRGRTSLTFKEKVREALLIGMGNCSTFRLNDLKLRIQDSDTMIVTGYILQADNQTAEELLSKLRDNSKDDLNFQITEDGTTKNYKMTDIQQLKKKSGPPTYGPGVVAGVGLGLFVIGVVVALGIGLYLQRVK